MFWNNVKSELEYQGISVKELAAKTGLQAQSIYNSISKNTLPTLDASYKISQILNVSLEYLLTGETNKKNDPILPYEDLIFLNDFHLLSNENKKLLKAIIQTMNKISSEITTDGENITIISR